MSGQTFLETSRKPRYLIIYEGITLFLSKKSKVLEPMSKMINSKFPGLLKQNKRFFCVHPYNLLPCLYGPQELGFFVHLSITGTHNFAL